MSKRKLHHVEYGHAQQFLRKGAERPTVIPSDARVRFVVDPRQNSYMEVFWENGGLVVRDSSGRISVLPDCANQIAIRREAL